MKFGLVSTALSTNLQRQSRTCLQHVATRAIHVYEARTNLSDSMLHDWRICPVIHGMPPESARLPAPGLRGLLEEVAPVHVSNLPASNCWICWSCIAPWILDNAPTMQTRTRSCSDLWIRHAAQRTPWLRTENPCLKLPKATFVALEMSLFLTCTRG